jgi:curved DNA-binding protein CbpA
MKVDPFAAAIHSSFLPYLLYPPMSSPLPDYYAILGVAPSATSQEIREAYKKKSLQCHPDRFPQASEQERSRLTRQFQSCADAQYVLSNKERREEYDGLRRTRGFTSFAQGEEEKEQSSSANFFSSFFQQAAGSAFGAGAGAGNTSNTAANEEETHPNGQPRAEGVFGDVFEEMLRPEVHRVVPVWRWVGAASGAGLGFILLNIPGALGGAFVGSYMGKIRDAKGRSVGSVFMSLNQGQRAEVLVSIASGWTGPKLFMRQTGPTTDESV